MPWRRSRAGSHTNHRPQLSSCSRLRCRQRRFVAGRKDLRQGVDQLLRNGRTLSDGLRGAVQAGLQF